MNEDANSDVDFDIVIKMDRKEEEENQMLLNK